MGAISRSSPRRLRARLRREYVFQFHLRGASFREIAEGIHARGRREGWKLPKNYGKRHAHQDLERYLAQRKTAYDAGVELEREIVLARCHQLLRRVWPRVEKGYWRAVREARLLVDRIVELEGMTGEGRPWHSAA